MSQLIDSFFSALTTRFRNENDLSDFTWAMIQSSPFFKEQWFDFFFKEKLSVDRIDSVERESMDFQSMGSRADFVINTLDGDRFVIEVKINDTNHHFDQYVKAYKIPNDHLGYITNYPKKEEGFIVKEWKDFYYSLKSSSDDLQNNEEKDMIRGYCTYLENICSIMDVKNIIDIEKMSSLYDLTKAFKLIVERSTDKYQVRFYKDYPADNAKRICFGVRFFDLFPEQEFFPYIGIWYNQPGPRICAGYWKDKGFGREICTLIRNRSVECKGIQLKYSKGPLEDWGYFFYMADDAKATFSNASSVDEQIEVLDRFLQEVLSFPLLLAQGRT